MSSVYVLLLLFLDPAGQSTVGYEIDRTEQECLARMNESVAAIQEAGGLIVGAECTKMRIRMPSDF